MEVARAWLADAPRLPAEIGQLLAGHPAFGPCLDWSAEPEVRLRFDGLAGEPRNSDLLVLAEDRHGPYLMAVEAKADEPFGSTVAEVLTEAVERRLVTPRSNAITRVEQLAAAIVGPRRPRELRLGGLRYQLLTAAAGAAAEASRRGIARVLLLVHEFWTDRTDDERHWDNAAALTDFVGRLAHDEMVGCGGGELVGPFALPGKPLFPPTQQFYVGKAVRNVRAGVANNTQLRSGPGAGHRTQRPVE